jgi:hypothetical protein
MQCWLVSRWDIQINALQKWNLIEASGLPTVDSGVFEIENGSEGFIVTQLAQSIRHYALFFLEQSYCPS